MRNFELEIPVVEPGLGTGSPLELASETTNTLSLLDSLRLRSHCLWGKCFVCKSKVFGFEDVEDSARKTAAYDAFLESIGKPLGGFTSDDVDVGIDEQVSALAPSRVVEYRCVIYSGQKVDNASGVDC